MNKKSSKFAFTLAEVFHPAEWSRKFAFTLAEVLITLGIIGVVAALTMPTLISNHKKQATLTKLKKFYTVMSQATNTAMSIHGSMQDWDGFTTSYNGEELKHWFDKYLRPYLKITDEYIDNGNDSDGENVQEALFVHFADGSLMAMTNWAGSVVDEKNTNHSNENYNGFIHVTYLTNPKKHEKPYNNANDCVDTFTFVFYDTVKRQYYFQPYANTNLANKNNRDYLMT